MKVWMGIGEFGVQLDLQGPELELSLGKPGSVEVDGCTLFPMDETEETWEYDLSPRDRGYEVDNFRYWNFFVSYIWVDPRNQETTAIESTLSLCREPNGSWLITIYSDLGQDLFMNLPQDTTQYLEERFQSIPSFTPYLIRGGAV